jgi:hypothetical protein
MAEKAILRQAQDEGVGLAIIPQQPLPLILSLSKDESGKGKAETILQQATRLPRREGIGAFRRIPP